MNKDIFIEDSKNIANMIKLLNTALPEMPVKKITVINACTYISYPELNLNIIVKNIKLHDLYIFGNELINNKNKYMYPVVFLNFCKKYITYYNTKLLYNNKHLQKLQFWSNQFKILQPNEIDSKHVLSEEALYVLYVIAVKSIKFIVKDNINVNYR